jgi:hypothetical protein
MSVPFYFDLLKPSGTRLKYPEANTQPQGKTLWLIFQAVYADGRNSSVYTPAEYHAVANYEYTDA